MAKGRKHQAGLTLSWSMVVAPMIVEVTFQRLLHQASASCVGVKPCFSATLAYSATASRANDLLYLPAPATCQLALTYMSEKNARSAHRLYAYQNGAPYYYEQLWGSKSTYKDLHAEWCRLLL